MTSTHRPLISMITELKTTEASAVQVSAGNRFQNQQVQAADSRFHGNRSTPRPPVMPRLESNG